MRDVSTAPSMLEAGPILGRPRKLQDIQAFCDEIQAYFAGRDAIDKPYTMHGLARALDVSRQTLLNYEQFHDDRAFVDAIKRARERVAEWTEDRLHQKGYHPAGAIFSLKNNFGWKDEQSVAVNVAVAVGIMGSDDARRGLLPQLVIDQIRPDNALAPSVETGVVTQPHSVESGGTFASTPSLSPESVNTYPVQKPRKRKK